MARFRFLLALPVAAALAILLASAVAAGTSQGNNARFSVATTVSISAGAGGTCPANVCDFGAIIPGSLSSQQTSDNLVQSNDPNGFQISAVALGTGTYTESGTCTPNAANTVPASSVQLTPVAVTGGTGSGGTAASTLTLSTTAQNLFSTAPLATGVSMHELLGVAINAPAATKPNTSGCSYLIPFNLNITAL